MATSSHPPASSRDKQGQAIHSARPNFLRMAWMSSSQPSLSTASNPISLLWSSQSKVDVKCEACSSGDTAVSFCHQCSTFICNTCVETHQKEMFEGHKVISVQHLKEGKAKADKEPSPTKCSAHQELLKVYCFDCDLLICCECTMKDHKEHKFEFNEAAAPKTKKDIRKELEPLKERVESLSALVKEVQVTKQEIEVQGDSVANTINTSFNDLFHIMEVQKQEMLEEASRLVGEASRLVGDKVDKLTMQEKNLSLAVAELQSVMDCTEQCVSLCTDNEVMSTQADIRRRIKRENEEHSKSGKSTEIVEQADMGVEVRCAEDLQQLCHTKAEITKLAVDPAQCTVGGEGLKAAKVSQKAEMILTVRLGNGKITKHKVPVTGELKSVHNGSVIQCDVDQFGPGEYCIHYTPTIYGHHELTVFVDGQHVAGSPFPVFVSVHPTQLGQPVRPVSVWEDLTLPSGISITSSGEVIVAQERGDLMRFDKHGKLVQRITRNQLGLDENNFTSIQVDKDDFIYLTLWRTSKIIKLSKNGTSVVKELSVNAPGHCFIAVNDEEVMVCERGNKGTIKVYDRELNYVRKIAGSNMGEFRSLAADSAGNIYVTDWKKLLIHAFSNQGEHLRSFGEGFLKKPLGLCVAGQFVYVCNNIDHNICVFTMEGELATEFGQSGAERGQFNTPIAVCVDKDGLVFVCDTRNNRVQVF